MKLVRWLPFGWLILAGCSRQISSPSSPDVLATVGTRVVRVADLESEIARRVDTGRAAPTKESLLDELVTREAMIVRALELGLAEDPGVRHRYEKLLLAELKERELQPLLAQAKVSPDARRAAGAGEARQKPAQIRLAALRFKINTRTTADKRAQFAQRLQEARGKVSLLPPGEPGFGALAEDYSDDQPTRYRGGDLGWFEVGRTNYSAPVEVLKAGNTLARVGEVSEVLHTDQGLFLVRLMERREAGQLSSEAFDAALHQKLLAQERKRIESEFAAFVRSRTQVQIFTQSLASVRTNSPSVVFLK